LFGTDMAQFFTGARHTEVRTLARDLFNEDNAAALVSRAQADSHASLRNRLAAGETADVAQFAREVSGATVADLLGLPVAAPLALFAAGERLAALALGTQTSTTLTPEVIGYAPRPGSPDHPRVSSMRFSPIVRWSPALSGRVCGSAHPRRSSAVTWPVRYRSPGSGCVPASGSCYSPT
jgi:cytochrome P450